MTATPRPAPRDRMRQRLQYLYGEERGAAAFERLTRQLDRFPARAGRSATGVQPGGRFDQADAVLITYGDTFLPDHPPTAGGPQTPLAALRAFAERHLDGLVSAIHILPFSPYSSDYGFSVIDYEQVNPDLGGWDDIEALGRQFPLMFDLVVNHVSAQGPWFQAFLRGEPPYDGYFIVTDPAADLRGVTRPRTTPLLTQVETANGPVSVWTTFSADQVDLNYANPAVLLRMVDVILGYIQRGAVLLRMDAVGYLWKEIGTSCIHLPQTHQIVKLFRDVLDDVAPDVAIVTETNVPHADNISYFGDGHDEAQMVYQFPLAPLVLHTLATGNPAKLATWAASLETPSDDTTFFNFEASHDGIGVVPARGILTDAEVQALADQVQAHGGQVSNKTNPDGSESPYELNATLFDILSDPNDTSESWELKRDRFLCSQAIMLALAGVPGIYVHSLFGSHNDQASFLRSGWKRDLNHERMLLARIEQKLADPGSQAARVFAGYRQLLLARREQPAFHPSAPQTVLDVDPGVFAVRRGPYEGRTILALHNVTARPLTVDLPSLGRIGASARDILTGSPVDLSGTLSMPPYAVCWLATDG
ncbi:MAG: alpha-amylase family glycosyl hydrolase [Chloroflexota bacterium]